MQAFYLSDRLTRLGLGFTGGVIVANTQIDKNIQNCYQNNIGNDSRDNFLKIAN